MERLLPYIGELLEKRGHVVVCIAEGAGQVSVGVAVQVLNWLYLAWDKGAGQLRIYDCGWLYCAWPLFGVCKTHAGSGVIASRLHGAQAV